MIRYAVINLPSRPDRLGNFKKVFAEAGFPLDELRVVPGVVIHPDDVKPHEKAALATQCGEGEWKEWFHKTYAPNAIGCCRAHVNALRQFLDSDAAMLMLFEDDCEFAEQAKERVSFLIDILWARYHGTAGNWIFNLDAVISSKKYADGEHIGKGLYKLRQSARTEAVVYTRIGAMQILELSKVGCEFDLLHNRLAHFGGAVYGCRPCLTRQRADNSDIMGMPVDYGDFTKQNTLDEK